MCTPTIPLGHRSCRLQAEEQQGVECATIHVMTLDVLWFPMAARPLLPPSIGGRDGKCGPTSMVIVTFLLAVCGETRRSRMWDLIMDETCASHHMSFLSIAVAVTTMHR